MKKLFYFFVFFFLCLNIVKAQPLIGSYGCGSVTDIDGNTYKTVQIGKQCWMGENLKVTHYNNGEPIPNVTKTMPWRNVNTGAYCDYNNDENNVKIYGRLYNWKAVTDAGKICPSGWHVPVDDEWTVLTDFLGGEYLGGGKMKEAGNHHWNTGWTETIAPGVKSAKITYQGINVEATNESGFTALPGGSRDFFRGKGTIGENNKGFHGCIERASFWSSTESNKKKAFSRELFRVRADILRASPRKECGLSVRCVKDN